MPSCRRKGQDSDGSPDWNHTTDSKAAEVLKIQEHRESHRCSPLSKRWLCKVGRTIAGTQRFTLRFGQVQALRSGETELQGIVDGLAQ